MDKIKLAIVATTASFVVGCAPLEPFPENPRYRDQTLQHPSIFFEETPQSRAVIASSALQANLAGCSFIQRYRLATNADFTATTNMFRYRAHMMGAERVVFIHHSEVDTTEGFSNVGNYEVVFHSGTSYRNNRYLSVMIGDLYDCPCPRDTCK